MVEKSATNINFTLWGVGQQHELRIETTERWSGENQTQYITLSSAQAAQLLGLLRTNKEIVKELETK